MRNFYSSVDGSDLVDGFYLGTESTMDAEYLAIDDGTNWQIVEDFGAVLPRIGISVFSVDFIIKAIDCGDLSA